MSDMVENRIGFVTVLYKSATVLEDFFASMAKIITPYKLYVIDNNETDSDVESLEKWSNAHNVTFQLIPFGENRGVARGNNLGVELALKDGCTWIGLINNDIEFDGETVIAGLLEQAALETADVLVPKMTYHGTSKIWFGGGGFTMHSAVTPHYHDREEDGVESSKQVWIDYAPTCFMLVRREVFERVGLFDPKYFVYYDDADWVYRYYKQGGRILYVGGLTVAHKVSVSTGGGSSPFTTYYATRNRVYFAHKNFTTLQWAVFATYFFGLRAPMRYCTIGNKLRKTYWKAVVDGVKMVR